MEKPMRILLLDDEEDVRVMMAEMLELSGFIVDLAENGTQAIESSLRQVYDFYLIDIAMDGMDGIEAIENMHIPEVSNSVIIVSARLHPTYIERAQNLGIQHFLEKPIRARDLEPLLVK